MNTNTDMTQIQKSEYDAILRQAVAVIDRTRTMVATMVCSAIGMELSFSQIYVYDSDFFNLIHKYSM